MFNMHVEGFRRVVDAELRMTKPVNLLLGRNRSGKSSIVYAIQAALTGQCAVQSRKGESVKQLVKDGASKASIELTMLGLNAETPLEGVRVERRITKTSQNLTCLTVIQSADGEPSFEAWEGTTTEQQKALYDLLGVTADQMEALLEAGTFLDMAPKDQTAFLASLAGSEVTAETVKGALPEWVATLPDAASSVLAGAIASSPPGPGLIDSADVYLRDERKKVKGVLKRLETVIAEEVSLVAPSMTDGEIESALAEANSESQRLSGTAAKRRELADYIDRGDAPAAMCRSEVEKLETEAKAVQQAMEAAESSLPAAKEELVTLKVERAEASLALTRAQAGRAESESILDLLAEGAPDGCPLCHTEIAEENVPALKADAEKTVGEQAALAQKWYEEESRLNPLVATAARAVSEKESTLLTGAERLKDIASSLSVWRDKEDVCTANLKRAQAELDELPEVSEEAVQALMEKVNQLEDQQRELRAFSSETGNRQMRVGLRDKLAVIVEALERLVDLFGSGDGSIRAKLVAKDTKLEALQAAVNGVVEDLLGARVAWPSGESPMKLRSMEAGTYAATKAHLSGAERYELALALQYGFAVALGVPLVVVDLEAGLDANAPGQILTQLKRMVDDWPALTVIATFARLNKPVVLDWCDTWLVEDGMVRLAEEETATAEAPEEQRGGES